MGETLRRWRRQLWWGLCVFWRVLPFLAVGLCVVMTLAHWEYAVGLAAAGMLLALVPPFRRWLSRQPGYVHYLSRVPGLSPPTALMLFLAWPFYVAVGWCLCRGLTEVGVPPGNRGLGELAESQVGRVLGALGFPGMVLWLTGVWVFADPRGHRASDAGPGSPTRLRWKSASERRWLLHAYLGTFRRMTEDAGVAALNRTLKGLPQYGLALLVFGLAASAAALGYYGGLLAVAGAVLALVPAYRRWLERQPGYRRRLSRLWGWDVSRPGRLALASVLWLAPWSVVFWALVLPFDEVRDVLAGPGPAVVGLLGLLVLFAWFVRGWRLAVPWAGWRSWHKGRHQKEWQTLKDEAERLRDTAKYREALAAARGLVEFARRHFGEEHLNSAAALDLLGTVEALRGEFDAAEPPLRRALELRREQLGVHADVAQTLQNLGTLALSAARLPQAEALLHEAAMTWRHCEGGTEFGVPSALNDLGLVFLSIRDFALAEAMFLEALEGRRLWAVGPDEVTTSARVRLARLCAELGECDLARQHLELARPDARRLWGDANPRQAELLHTLADLRERQGDVAEARRLFRQLHESRRLVLGDAHPETLAALRRLAPLHERLGDPREAERTYREVLACVRASGRPAPAWLAEMLYELAALCVRLGRPGEALALMGEAQAIDDRLLEQVFSFGSEAERLATVAVLQDNLARYVSLIRRHFAQSPGDLYGGLDLVLRRKGLATELLARQRRSIRGGVRPELRPKLKELERLEQQIARRELDGPGPEGDLVHLRTLNEWYARKERLESELARSVAGPDEAPRERPRLSTLAAALPEGSALVEFVRLRDHDFRSPPGAWGEPRYLAFVLPDREPHRVRLLDLGKASEVDALVAAYRDQTRAEASARDMNRRRDRETAQTESPSEPGRRLRRAVFDVLVPALGRRTRLLLSPDGDLALVPFEALPDDGDGFLIDRYRISYVGVGRDVRRFGEPPPEPPGPPLVLADPDFDLGGDGQQAAEEVGRQSRDMVRRRFTPLPGTRLEGERVAALWGVRPLLGREAVESALKASRSPRVLHLATHGFFLPPQSEDAADPGAARDRFGRLAGRENPLLRSGLALAGANAWLQDRAVSRAAEDGILNALDVTGLHLLGTELVVLSACQSGVGDVQPGEGVSGLRRAFLLAGARTLVMSLWDVPDEETAELMTEFYKGVLAGRSRADALREAQLLLKRKHPDPRVWGAFICQGDPGPLSAS